MANLEKQTDTLLKNKKTQSSLETMGNEKIDQQELNKELYTTVDKPTLGIEEKMQNVDADNIDLIKKYLINEITVNMFGDPGGGFKYPGVTGKEGTDEDRTFETNRLDSMDINALYDEFKYWDSQAKEHTYRLEGDAETPVKEWFEKMYKRFYPHGQ